MNSGKIIVQIGNIQKSFNDGGFYSKEACDLIESIVSCNKTELSDHGGSGRIRFVDGEGSMLVQLSVIGGNCRMSDERKAIVVIRSKNKSIKSCAYFGVESDLDFVSVSDEYNIGSSHSHVESIKMFYKSWQVKKGEICSSVIMIDDKAIFDEIVKDDFFKDCYVLLAE